MSFFVLFLLQLSFDLPICLFINTQSNETLWLHTTPTNFIWKTTTIQCEYDYNGTQLCVCVANNIAFHIRQPKRWMCFSYCSVNKYVVRLCVLCEWETHEWDKHIVRVISECQSMSTMINSHKLITSHVVHCISFIINLYIYVCFAAPRDKITFLLLLFSL